MTTWNWPWQWCVNSQFTLNYIYFLLYLHPGQLPEPRPLAHPSPSLSRSGCGRNMLQLLSTHRPYFPSLWKKHCGKMWLLLESCLGIEAEYGEQEICAAPAAPGSWKVSRCLAVQHMQGNFVQAAWHRAHMQLKGKCQFLFLLARTKTNTQLWFFEARL